MSESRPSGERPRSGQDALALRLYRYTVDKGLAGGTPDTPATYFAMCHIFCDSVEAFQTAFGPHAQAIMADIPNYTDLQPVIQISEVVVG